MFFSRLTRAKFIKKNTVKPKKIYHNKNYTIDNKLIRESTIKIENAIYSITYIVFSIYICSKTESILDLVNKIISTVKKHVS